MTIRCDLENHPRACAIAQGRYPRPQCKGCEAGEKNIRAEAVKAAPLPDPTGNNDPTEKKETPVATDKKDVILKRIENEKRCTKSRLMNFCGATADQVAEATKALEAEGKIKVHPGIREGAVIYTLPSIPKDYEGAPVAPAKKSSATPPHQDTCQVEAPGATRASAA